MLRTTENSVIFFFSKIDYICVQPTELVQKYIWNCCDANEVVHDMYAKETIYEQRNTEPENLSGLRCLSRPSGYLIFFPTEEMLDTVVEPC